MPVKKAHVVAPARRILKGRETRFSLTRGVSGVGAGESLGSFLSVGSSMKIDLYKFLVIDRIIAESHNANFIPGTIVYVCERIVKNDR